MRDRRSRKGGGTTHHNHAGNGFYFENHLEVMVTVIETFYKQSTEGTEDSENPEKANEIASRFYLSLPEIRQIFSVIHIYENAFFCVDFQN
jgi:hypothetical protein